MAEAQPLELSFPGLSRAEAGTDAALLEQAINDALRGSGADPVARQHRTDPTAADLGTVVQILLAAPATIILARGIAAGIRAYMSRSNRGEIVVTRPDGTRVTVTALESRDASKVMDRLGLGGGKGQDGGQ